MQIAANLNAYTCTMQELQMIVNEKYLVHDLVIITDQVPEYI